MNNAQKLFSVTVIFMIAALNFEKELKEDIKPHCSGRANYVVKGTRYLLARMKYGMTYKG